MADKLTTKLINELLSGSSVGPLTSGGTSLLLENLVRNKEKRCIVKLENQSLAYDLYACCIESLSDLFVFYPENEEAPAVPGFYNETQRYRKEAIIRFGQSDPCCAIGTKASFNEKNIPLGGANKIIKLEYKEGAQIERNAVLNNILELGYIRSINTKEPGHYSLRGDILDVFPLHFKKPFRLSFDFDKIEKISLYDPSTQITTKKVSKLVLFEYKSSQVVNNISFIEHSCPSFFLSLSKKGGFFTAHPNNEKKHFDTGFKRCLAGDKNPQARIHEVKAQMSQYKNSIIVGKTNSLEFSGVVFEQKERGYLPTSFSSELYSFLYVSQDDVFEKSRSIHKWSSEKERLREINKTSVLNIAHNDLVVHRTFGIGLFKGVVKNKLNNTESIELEYANNSQVFVSLDQLSLIHKYIGSGKKPNISTIGSKKWSSELRKAKKETELVAHEIVSTYTDKAEIRKFNYVEFNDLYGEPKRSFPFTETKDQAIAIKEVLKDLNKNKPMDRLVCGDVGFGKTEVAIRAIFKAFLSEKLSVFLCPTTILADQHFRTCKKRLSNLGVSVLLLSRFQSKKEQKHILGKLEQEGVDLLIGTHRILSKDVVLPNLGLLIVDEEHRFGVKHKEQIRALKTGVDVLTLTATPIPRTLQQSMVGIKKISTILTPPKTRRPIITTVQYFDWGLIYKKISDETYRGGQVYFLHNNVQTIPIFVDKISSEFPLLSVVGLSGKMNTAEIEKISLSFFSGSIDVLVCTTIIESGLDISNANSIIINDAQKLGLSQLYQIRGRVGRGQRQAYCALLIPKRRLEKDAFERLKTLEQNTSLGSGYKISMKDLEIRGAGSIFGYKQSGHISSIGFQMYCDLLAGEIKRKNTSNAGPDEPPAVFYNKKPEIPTSYIENPKIRLDYYYRISKPLQASDIDQIKKELIDVFGPPPVAVLDLIKITKIKAVYSTSVVKKITIKDSTVDLVLHIGKEKNRVDGFISDIVSFKHPSVKNVFLKDPKKTSVRVLFFLSPNQNPLDFLINFVHLFEAL